MFLRLTTGNGVNYKVKAIRSLFIAAKKPVVSCQSDEIGISLSRAEYNRSDYLQITLRDRNCLATYDEAHIFLNCSLRGCGTTMLETDTHLVYSNDVYMIKDTVKGGIVSNHVSRIAFSCSFKKHNMIRQEPQMDVKTSVYATEGMVLYQFIYTTNNNPNYYQDHNAVTVWPMDPVLL